MSLIKELYNILKNYVVYIKVFSVCIEEVA